VTLARNLGSPLEKITTVNMDFMQGYRPNTNMVRRPTMKGGKGYALTGHHEIMFPLAAASEELKIMVTAFFHKEGGPRIFTIFHKSDRVED
jgi:hypothetical protein